MSESKRKSGLRLLAAVALLLVIGVATKLMIHHSPLGALVATAQLLLMPGIVLCFSSGRTWQGVVVLALAVGSLVAGEALNTALRIILIQYQPEVLEESVPPAPLPCPEAQEPAGLPVQHAFGGRL